jgi:DUF4097 and DUF4098 domain-containing protein YvlB
MALLLAICGCVNAADQPADHDADGDGASRINGSIHVPDGAQRSDLSTVNGSINIGDAATIAAVHTVNGAITLGTRSKAASLNTVNGSITLDAGAQVSATVESVNGALTLHNDAQVTGSLMNVNGLIALTAAHVGGGLETVNGDVSLSGASHVDGGILVKKSSGALNFEDHVPRIVIGPGTTVAGSLRFEREVKLYVSDRATIGAVTGATPIRFSGESVPRDL